MIRVTKLYRWHAKACFDRESYCTKHMHLTREQLLPYGLLRLESDHRLSSRAPANGEVIATVHAYFKSVDQAQAALTAAGPVLITDAARYTNLQPEIRFSAVTAYL